MALSVGMTALVCAGTFAGGLVDSMAGGGGLITLPVYFLTGLPAHMALGTNKISANCGALISSLRYAKNGCVPWRAALPGMAVSILGALLGARLVLLVSDRVLQYLLVALLPVIALVVLRDKNMDAPAGARSRGRMAALIALIFLVGVYDGFYGPGAGTFYLLLLVKLGRFDTRSASGAMKWINLGSGLGSLVVFFLSGNALIWLGLLAGAASVAGSYVGTGLVIKSGAKAVRPVILLVLAILFLKVASGLF